MFAWPTGSNPIDVTDSSWEMYVLVQKIAEPEGDHQSRLLGFAAAYRFYHYPDSLRLRLSQVSLLFSYILDIDRLTPHSSQY